MAEERKETINWLAANWPQSGLIGRLGVTVSRQKVKNFFLKFSFGIKQVPNYPSPSLVVHCVCIEGDEQEGVACNGLPLRTNSDRAQWPPKTLDSPLIFSAGSCL